MHNNICAISDAECPMHSHIFVEYVPTAIILYYESIPVCGWNGEVVLIICGQKFQTWMRIPHRRTNG